MVKEKKKHIKEQEKKKKQYKDFYNQFKYDDDGNKLTTAQINKKVLNADSVKRKEKNEEYRRETSEDSTAKYDHMKYKFKKTVSTVFADWSENPRNIQQTVENDFR